MVSKITHTENKYIRSQTSNFPSPFIHAILRLFDMIKVEKIADGCLPCSVLLYIAAKYYGVDIDFCFGLCRIDAKPFYHAWTQCEDKIIDLAIYGNANYSIFSSVRKINLPIVNEDNGDREGIFYMRDMFDDDWKYAAIRPAVGMTMEKYMDGAGSDILWKRLAQILNIPQSKESFALLRSIAKNSIIKNS